MRVPRTEFELAKALREQLVILRDALEKLSSDFAHAKTVAGVLRVLVYDKGNNTPLLFSLAEKKNDKLFVKLEGPPALQAILPLKDFLQELHFASGTEKIEMTIEEFIGFASQQEGLAHEDHGLDKNYLFSKGAGLLIGGAPPNIRAIHGYGNTVYVKGAEFLQKHYPVIANSLI